MQQTLIINRLSAVICRLPTILSISTSVENPLQISLFLQNKANLPDGQMNVSTYYIKTYKMKPPLGGEKTNPNKPNC